MRLVKSGKENSDQVSKNYENSITGGFSVRSTFKNLVTWSPDHLVTRKRSAFTMAEILLSLTIIGVVAAITLPSLTGNINERTWNTQRKALYSRMSQALSLMPNLNGYGIGSSVDETKAQAAQVFIANGFSKVLKINNICDKEHISDCGIAGEFVPAKGTKYSVSDMLTLDGFVARNPADEYQGAAWSDYVSDTDVAAFETANGESVLVYYNPFCQSELANMKYNYQGLPYFLVRPKVCVNFVFDMNGKKGPNAVNKDIGFITAFYPTDSVVVMPLTLPSSEKYKTQLRTETFDNARALCSSLEVDARVPNLWEAMSLLYNKYLLFGKENGDDLSTFWSSTSHPDFVDYAYYIHPPSLMVGVELKSNMRFVRCLKR